MKTISIPTNDRPQYLRQVLESIRACPEHEDWVLVFSCEPNHEIKQLINTINWMGLYVSTNIVNRRTGINTNTFLAASLAFSLGSKFNLYLEEDVVISRDTLAMADQFYREKVNGVLCLRRWHHSQKMDEPTRVQPANHGLLGNGFAWRRELWEKTIRPWWFWYEPNLPAFGWDWSVSYGLDNQRIRQWRPMVNRSRNIGVQGINTASGSDLNHFGPLYDGAPVNRFEFDDSTAS